MPIRIVDTYDQVLQLFLHTPFDLHRWRTYAARISPQLAQKCELDARDYDFQKMSCQRSQARLRSMIN